MNAAKVELPSVSDWSWHYYYTADLPDGLFAEPEVLDGTPIPYYVNNTSNRVKTLGDSSRVESWWLRGSLGNSGFNFIPDDGGTAGQSKFTNATNYKGVVLFGCL